MEDVYLYFHAKCTNPPLTDVINIRDEHFGGVEKDGFFFR